MEDGSGSVERRCDFQQIRRLFNVMFSMFVHYVNVLKLL